MSQFLLNIDEDMFNDIYIEDGNLFDYSHRFNFYYGGAGSGKSRYIIQKIVIKGLKIRHRIMMCRRYGTTLLNSVMNEVKEVLRQFGIYQYCQISDYNKRYILPNGTEIIFVGLDDEQKLLSLSDIGTIFLEELFEIEAEKLDQCSLRLRAQGVPNEIYGAWNPISKSSYLYERVVTERHKYYPNGELYLLKTTYKDNKFLTEDYVKSLEALKLSNFKKYLVFALAEWGSNQDALVYKNVFQVDFNINKVLKLPKAEVRIGMDFGVVDPTALIVSVFDHVKQRIFIIDEHYETGMTLDDTYKMLVNKQLANTRQKFYGDNADARAMNFLRSKGVRIEPTKKVKIEAGISFLQNYTIYVHPKCVNSMYELENYTYKLNTKTNKYEDDAWEGPDHLMDALRYAASDLYNNKSMLFNNNSIFRI